MPATPTHSGIRTEVFTQQCLSCGYYYKPSDVLPRYTYAATPNYGYFCIVCAERSTLECPHCHVRFDRGYMRHTGDETLVCAECYTNEYRFPMQRVTEADSLPLIGVELEVSFGRGVMGLKTPSAHAIPVEIGQDGSIFGTDEIEFRTMPMSREWIYAHRQSIMEWLRKLRNNTGVSDNSHHCGIHIHFSRKGTTPQQIIRVCKLVYNNWEFWGWLSERTEGALNNFSRGRDSYYVSQLNEHKLQGHEKYDAVNLCHQQTIEIRLFSGTLKPLNFLKNIEAVLAMVDYCAEDRPTDLKSFLTWLFADSGKIAYKTLCTWIKRSARTNSRRINEWMGETHEYSGFLKGLVKAQSRSKKTAEHT